MTTIALFLLGFCVYLLCFMVNILFTNTMFDHLEKQKLAWMRLILCILGPVGTCFLLTMELYSILKTEIFDDLF